MNNQILAFNGTKQIMVTVIASYLAPAIMEATDMDELKKALVITPLTEKADAVYAIVHATLQAKDEK